MAFAFNPVDGLLNSTSFPDKPASNAAARQQFQELFNQVRDYINSQSSNILIPVGTVFMLFHNPTTVPNGYLKLEGQEVDKTTYQSLWSIYGTTYGASTDPNKFKLPDMRGRFARGFDNGSGLDTGRVFGSAQLDELKSHKHTSTYQYQKANATPDDNNWSHPALGDGGSFITKTFSDVNNTGGAETRPKNLTCIFIVKY